MKAEVELVDYGGGNVGSVRRCLDRLEIPYKNVDATNQPSGNRPVIVPGVGAFGEVMRSLQRGDLDRQIKTVVNNGTPFLGICVGMQILFESSEESPGVPGLSLLEGDVVKFVADKVPQIGWNQIESGNTPVGFVYFVNSFYARPTRPEVVLYEAEYGGTFCAAVKTANITAFQFHPEKSGAFGAELLSRWVEDASGN